MDDNSPTAIIVLLVVAIVLIVLSSLFSASESAFLASNKLRVRFLREKGDKRAIRTARLLEDKERLVNTLLVANELANIGLSVIITMIALKIFGKAGVGIATFIVTLLLLIFGEITPKCITTRYPESFAFAVSGIITFLVIIMKPFVAVFTAISRFFLRLFHMNTQKENVSFTEDEIKTFIDVGSEEGIVGDGEKKMMNRVFKFNDLAAVDIMIPRRDIVAVPLDIDFDSVVALSQKTLYARFPVYRKDIDDVVGVLYVKDMLFCTSDEDRKNFSVKDIMRPPLFIIGTKKMTSIQQMLRENHQSMAIVIDEYSGTDGILTNEDIAYEIFGDVEIDGNTEKKRKDNEDSSSIVIDGAERLMDLQDKLHIPLVSKDSETISGFICEKLEHIPIVGEHITSDGYLFTVIAMDGLRIAKIRIENTAGEIK
ncbi:MAG: hemolysin family protein [Treponema sp.]|nr:hemolysin family protein [Treponema sp.]